MTEETNNDSMLAASNLAFAVGLWFAVVGTGCLICIRWAG